MATGEKCYLCGHPDYDHGSRCHWRRQGVVSGCDCPAFVSPTAKAVADLPFEEKKDLAVANFLGIKPREVESIEQIVDGRGEPIGLVIVSTFPTNMKVEDWVESNLPKAKIDWVTDYLEKREKTA